MAPGFMMYIDDWMSFAEDYTNEEIGAMVRAVLEYFKFGVFTDFDDRGMRQFYRQEMKSVDLDKARYEKKCLDNGYNAYKAHCKGTPLSKDEWIEQRMVTDGNEPEPTVTNTNSNANANSNSQQSIINNQLSDYNLNTDTRGSVRGGGGGYEPMTQAEFEKARQAKLATLGVES